MISTHWREPHRPTERELRLTDVYLRQTQVLLASRKKKTAEARSPLTPLLSSLSTLALTTPVAMLVHGATKHGAAITFAMGVAWAAIRFGWRGALPLAAASVVANNFFVQPPAFAFQAVTAFDVYVFAGLLFVSFSRELVAWYEGGVGAFVRRCFPIVSANLYLPRPGAGH